MYPILEELTISVGVGIDLQNAVGCLVLDKFAMDDSKPHAAIYAIRHNKVTELAFLPYSIVSIASAGRGATDCFAFNDWGKVAVFQDGEMLEEDLQLRRGPIRNSKLIGSGVYCCGADLQVYKREEPGNWQSVGPKDQDVDEYKGSHLEGIDGFSEQEIYAAGRKGIIWWFDGQEWNPVQSATNLSYFDVHCTPDGTVYACGQAGITAKGRYDSFEVFTPPSPGIDLWSISGIAGRVFVCGLRSIFEFKDGSLLPVPEAMEIAQTFGTLSSTSEILWSFGAKHVIRTDGSQWVRTEQVQVE